MKRIFLTSTALALGFAHWPMARSRPCDSPRGARKMLPFACACRTAGSVFHVIKNLGDMNLHVVLRFEP